MLGVMQYARKISKGQVAHHGTMATQWSFFTTTRPSCEGVWVSTCVYSQSRQGRPEISETVYTFDIRNYMRYEPLRPLGASDIGGLESEYFSRDLSSIEGIVGISDRAHA